VPKKKTQSKTTKSKKPTHRRCGTMSVHFRLLERDPEFRLRQYDLEHKSRDRRRAGAVSQLALPITIPVVVHVVYNTKAERISVAQVKSQVAVLNRDYRAKNPDRSKAPAVWKGLVADAGIQFKLATKDPNGAASNGIVYVQSSETSFSDDDSVKSSAGGGSDPWDTKTYLNIWVCSLSDQLLGYAQFPGGPAPTDGVVILNTAFGTKGSAAAPFNLGRTATHEVGHWLNLRHIWGDHDDCGQDDLIVDTPSQATANFGKPKFPKVSCSNGPNGDMYMNYMDYVDDASMCMFTPEQVSRMHAALEGPRKKLF
jgi:hypothetical protein